MHYYIIKCKEMYFLISLKYLILIILLKFKRNLKHEYMYVNIGREFL